MPLMQNWVNFHGKNCLRIQYLIIEAYPKPYQTSKMEHFTEKKFPFHR